MPQSAIRAFRARADLQKYGANAFLLFAVELGLPADDIHSIAATALTDGNNDKKCDLLWVDRDEGRAIICQGYFSAGAKKKEAPANKASDLNTAVAWLLSGQPDSLPVALQSAGNELHSALSDGKISTIEIWYCHNLPESKNVKRELDKVQQTAHGLVKKNYGKSVVPTIAASEVGLNTIEDWYKSVKVPIIITDEFKVKVGTTFQTTGDRWSAVTASIPLSWLHQLYGDYKNKLFAPNVRGYLGSRRSDRNINHNIKETAKSAPDRFWAYNNGITALVNDFEVKPKTLKVSGIGIVNGAQTTGAIGSLKKSELKNAFVLARFVKTEDRDVVQEIIRFNNTQNKVDTSDFRSNDPIQDRLRNEFATDIPGSLYLGFRRGGDEDKIKRPQNLISSQTAAQALVAFHQDPHLAYNEKSRIWESDGIYGKFFNDKLTARHILFAFTLLRAIEDTKREILLIPNDERTESQKNQIEFLRKRGATFLLASAIARCFETILGRAIANPFELEFVPDYTVEDGIEAWKPMLGIAFPFVKFLAPAADSGLKSSSTVKGAIEHFVSLVESTKLSNDSTFKDFSKRVCVRGLAYSDSAPQKKRRITAVKVPVAARTAVKKSATSAAKVAKAKKKK